MSAGGERRRMAQAVLHFTVAALTSLLVVVLAGLLLLRLRPTWLAGLRNAIPAKPPTALHPGARSTGTPGSSSARGSLSPASTRPGTLVEQGSPVLSGLQPATGSPGDTVTVVGTNLFSSDGTVLVSFGGQPAATRCPTERRCLATVPAERDGRPTISVRVRTASGVSNPLPFHYG